ncbi:MAG TPA: hypothetical protein VMS56_03425 [Thermoanaerobaculia bacterium]|nr:hypothetical protein [Thermoanaerobaculia bacterium]
MMRGGGARLTGFIVGQLEREAERLFENDVPQEDRRRLMDELARLKENIDAERVDMMVLQPVLAEIRSAIRDQTLTREEVESLIREIEAVNDAAAERPISVRAGPPRPGTGASALLFA